MKIPLLLSVFVTIVTLPAAEPLVIDLWPEGVPEPEGYQPPKIAVEEEKNGVKLIKLVTKPSITLYQPPADQATGTAVLVCPGGGYGVLAIEHEGTQVCEWLNSIGVTAALLQYRVPRRAKTESEQFPLADAHQAMSILRTRADEFAIKPDRIGILGFSAGGHLSVMTALKGSEIGGAEKPHTRPDFLIPVYPAYLTPGKDMDRLRPEIQITDKSPPICLIHAHNDGITAAGSALLYLEYRKRQIPAEIHVYHDGGHGFGMRQSGLPVASWPQRVAEWMKSIGVLP